MPESENSTSVLAFIGAVWRHWLTLMSGGLITVALGIFNYLSPWPVPKWLYGVIIVLFVVMGCYLAWRDAQTAVTQVTLNEQKRQFLAGRLQSLLNEAGTVEYGFVPLASDEGMEKISRSMAYTERVKNFIKQHYGPETASRYDKERSNLLESLLADCYRQETKSNTNNA